MSRLLAFFAIAILLLSSSAYQRVWAQSVASIEVISSNAPDYHFRIKQYDASNNLIGTVPFFPIGWYATAVSDFQAMKDAGATVVLMYEGSVIERYRTQLTTSDTNTPFKLYRACLDLYLAELETIGLKAIIDIAPFTTYLDSLMYADVSWNLTNAASLATQYYKNPNIFAWYLADEPEQVTRIKSNGDKTHVTEPTLQDVYDVFHINDPAHPVYVVTTDPKVFPPYTTSSFYDIFGADPYPFNTDSDFIINELTNYYHVGGTSYATMEKVRNNSKMGGIMVVSAQDYYMPNRYMSANEVRYAMFSPLVHGARGLLNWWNWPNTLCPGGSPREGHMSADLQTKVHDNIKFLTSTNNHKQVSILDVFMNGEDKTSSSSLESISIDGSTQTYTTKALLDADYKLFTYNLLKSSGAVYKFNTSTMQWEAKMNGISGLPGYDVNSLFFHNNTLYAGIQSGGSIFTSTNGAASWTAATGKPAQNPLVYAFGVNTNGRVIATGTANGELYEENGSWSQVISTIHANVSGVIVTANTVTCFVTSNSWLLAGTDRGVFRSNDAGRTWSYANNSVFRWHAGGCYAGDEYKSYPMWSATSVDVSGSPIIYMGSHGAVFRGIANGSFWTKQNTGLPSHAVWSLNHARVYGTTTEDYIFAGTGRGLYIKLESSSSWTKVTGIPDDTHVWDLAVYRPGSPNNDIVYAATSRGVYKVTLSGVGVPTVVLMGGNAGLPFSPEQDGIHTDCRAIAVDDNGDVYVGTKEFHDAYRSNSSGDLNTSKNPDFPLFNYVVKKYDHSYYIFAVNDFEPTVTATMILDNVLESNETVFHVTEFVADGLENQINDLGMRNSGWIQDGLPNGVVRSSITLNLGGYETKAIRLDVIKWSDQVVPLRRECLLTDGQDACKTVAGGIASGTFDEGNTDKDLLLMWMPEMGSNPEPFRYRMAWNIRPEPGGSFSFDGINNLTFDADNTVADNNFGSICYGELTNSFGNVRGGDVKAINYGGGDGQEIFFMAMPTNAAEYRIKVGWNLTGSSTTPVTLNDFNSLNFPATGDYGVINRTGPTTDGTGGGITMYSPASNIYRLLTMHLIDSTAGENGFRFKKSMPVAQIPSGIPTSPFTTLDAGVGAGRTTGEHVTPGWETEGAGMDLGNMHPKHGTLPDKYKELVLGGIEVSTNEFRYIPYNFDPVLGESDNIWRSSQTVPISPSGYRGPVKDAGLTLIDLDDDGDDDIVIMGIAQECWPFEEHPSVPAPTSPMFIRIGINRLINNQNSFLAKSAAVSQQYTAPATVPLGTKGTIQNQPNPFSTSTMITYTIEQESSVELEVYSILGTVVLQIDAGKQKSGSYQLPFDSGNLPNGIYLCRLKVNGTVVSSAKMVLAR